MRKTLIALAALLFVGNAWAGKCTVTEMVSLPRDAAGQLIYVGDLGPNTLSQAITFTTSTASTALASSTTYVRIWCDAVAHIRIGLVGVAALAGDAGLTAGAWEYLHVNRGSSQAAFYVAIYDGTS